MGTWLMVTVGASLAACGGGAADLTDGAPGDPIDGAVGLDAAAGSDATPADLAVDDFERAELGADWVVVFPEPPNDQVRILGDSDLGMGPGPQGFFLVNWTARAFSADQFCEASIPSDATPGWVYMVYVRWRAADRARYGFAYNGDPGQPTYGDWIFKYDGVPSDETRVFANQPAAVTPEPGDTLRVEIVGYTLRGYLNDTLVLEATDTDATRIADGVPGLAARWATGNQATDEPATVWESWSGGSM